MVTRRTMLTAAAGAAAIGALPLGVSGIAQAGVDPGDPRRSPRTLSSFGGVINGKRRAKKAEFTLTHLGVTWDGPAAKVRVRTARGWGRWRVVAGCGAGPDGQATGTSALLVVPGTTSYEVWVPTSGSATITEINTVDGLRSVATAAVSDGMPMPDGSVCPVPYLTRAAWGADESLRFIGGIETWPAESSPAKVLTVHHTAGASGDPDPAGTVRAIYYYQAITRGWGDIGYHLLIDEAGRVYQGRWSGGAAPVYYHGAIVGGRPWMNVGGHVQGFNTGNVGVCLLGNFTSGNPTAAAQASLLQVLAALAKASGIRPLATVTYVQVDTGQVFVRNAISGHRDWASTACPGDTYYPHLVSLRPAVNALIPVPPPPPPPQSAPGGPPVRPDGTVPDQPVTKPRRPGF